MKISTIVPMRLLLIGSIVAMVQGTTAAQQSGQRAADDASERSGLISDDS